MSARVPTDVQVDTYLKQLKPLLDQPSISSTGDGMEQSAKLVSDALDAFGFDRIELMDGESFPIVYAELGPGSASPTVCFYGHYDVQPIASPELWHSAPFDAELRDGRLFARGVGDNKGQFFTHLCAVDWLRQEGWSDNINVKMLIEGEEEIGSPSLEKLAAADSRILADVDLVVIADGPLHPSGQPTIIYGNRGVLAVEISITTASSPLHSGNFGGPTPNAANMLMNALNSVIDGNVVTLHGFSDDIELPPTARELAGRVNQDEQALRRRYAIDGFVGKFPFTEQLLCEPAVSINGLTAGYQGDGKQAIIPNTAKAKLDIRLVPNQEPDGIFTQLRDCLQSIDSRFEVTYIDSFPPMASDPDTSEARLVIDSLQFVWGEPVLELPMMGGSVPAAYLKRMSGAPTIIVPYANPDQNNHAPNENLDLDCFARGVGVSAELLRLMSRRD